MADREKLILVTGATGHQGGAVARHLIQNGFKVRALTRNPKAAQAKGIKTKGIELVQGDLYKPETIEPHLKNIYGIYAVQNFWEHGYQGEVQQGRSLVDLAKKADVEHFVYSSVASANKGTGLSHFESKYELEQYLKQSGVNYTIFRPVFFMENFIAMHNQILEGKLVSAIENDIPLQMIAVDDIGAFVAQAFMHPDIFGHKEIDIASDSKTMPEAAQIFSDVLGEQVKYVKLDLEEFKNIMGDEYAKMMDWFNKVGYDVDIDALRQNYDVDLTSFKDWVRKADFHQYKVRQHK
ncbi:MAG: NmrA/HSCARG family protein [Bacillota bacterium]